MCGRWHPSRVCNCNRCTVHQSCELDIVIERFHHIRYHKLLSRISDRHCLFKHKVSGSLSTYHSHLVALEHSNTLIISCPDTRTTNVCKGFKRIYRRIQWKPIRNSQFFRRIACCRTRVWIAHHATLWIVMTPITYLIMIHHAFVEHYRYHRVRHTVQPISATQFDVHHRTILSCHNFEKTFIYPPRIRNWVANIEIRITLHNILIPQHLSRQHIGHINTPHRISKKKDTNSIRTGDMESPRLRLACGLQLRRKRPIQCVDTINNSSRQLNKV